MATAMKITAVLLVAACLSSQLVDAGVRSELKARLKNPSGSSSLKSAYRILANHLHTATKSSELADNTKAAESLPSEQLDANEGLSKLVNAFKSLKGDTGDPESMCSNENLANMRIVAEAMREGGNMGPKRLTVPIDRLNQIIILFIAGARPICPTYLDKKWHNPWNPKFTDKHMEFYVKQLTKKFRPNFLYEGYFDFMDSDGLDDIRSFWRLYVAITQSAKHDLDTGRTEHPDWSDREAARNRASLALQLEVHVYKPCKEFVNLQEAHNVLDPYSDLLISWYIIFANNMKTYFNNRDVKSTPFVDLFPQNDDVKELVFGYRACQRFLEMPKKDALNKMLESIKNGDPDVNRKEIS